MGIAPNSHFILKTTASLSTQVLEKYIKTIPSIDFSIKKVLAQENTYEIIPKEELKTNQIYSIEVSKGPIAKHIFSWAYQVKAPFQVTSAIPGDRALNVPTNTGIELYFNRDDVSDPESYIEISPKITGKFKVSANIVSFIPDNPLNERTVYTVKIKAGLGSKSSKDILSEEKIIQFQTSLNYSGNQSSSLSFSRQFTEFKPSSDILFGIDAYNVTKVTANVYRFDSAKEFIDSVNNIQSETPWVRYYSDLTGKLPENKKVFGGDFLLEKVNYSYTLRMPQEFKVGYYAIIISSGKTLDISWFQVNPVANFSAFSSAKSLIWLKDINSEKDISDAQIFYNDTELGKSGADGVAVFNTPKELVKDNSYSYYLTNERKFFIAKIPTGDLVIPMESSYGYNSTLSKGDSWWDYISLNKNIYLPTDTIHFWAIDKPRDGSVAGDDIDVELTNLYWGDDQSNTITYAHTKLKATEYNTVTGELLFENLKPGLYYLTFKKGSEVITRQTVTVGAYIKPAYKISVSPDKNIVFADDSVTFKVKAEFFDGTPVANTSLLYNAYASMGKNYKGTINLDSNGEGSFVITPEYVDSQGYWPSYLSVNVKPSKSEEGQISTNSLVFVFGPHINTLVSEKNINSNFVFSLKSREVVIKNSFRGEPYWNSEEYLGNSVSGAKTSIDVTEINYIREQTSTGYDQINKLTYPIYYYKTEEIPVTSKDIVADQNGLAQFTFTPENKKTYKLSFTTHDNFGRTAKDIQYVYGGLNRDYDAYSQDVYLYNPDSNENYKIGDSINLQLQNGQGVLPTEGKNKYLFMSVNNGDISYKIQDTPKYNSTFELKDIPNIGIWPSWFANGQFHNSYFQNISFDANERRLNIDIKKDKQIYKPGDIVNLDIKVTDKNNNPVKTEVNLSALDEAVFSIKPDEIDITDNLYKDIYSQVIIRVSNTPPNSSGGAEKGGGDEGTPRSNIQEMAIFKTIETDTNGYAKIQFKLPDNITSWRLTSQAVSKDLYAGKKIYYIPVTLPLFIDATLNKTYLAGDKPILRLRVFGNEVNLNSIDYSVESSFLPSKIIKISGGNSVNVPLGTLTVGSYEITMRANNGDYSDALTRPIDVLSSYFTKGTSDFYEGTGDLKIKSSASGYTTLTIGSFDQGRMYNDLKLLSYEDGIRLDQKGTKLIANILLNENFKEKNELPDLQIIKYQTYDGGLRLLPYSTDDLELSAISAHLFKNLESDQASLKNYLLQSLNDTKSDISRISRALYGLTAFNEPVLTKIQKIKDDKALNIKDKIFIALALDSMGAKEEARIYYEQSIKPSLIIETSYAYVSGLKGDETILATTLVAALTASLGEPELPKLVMYIEQNSPTETLNNFERLLYIKSALAQLNTEEVSFAYETRLKSEKKTLKNGELFELNLSKEDLASFKLSEINGKIGIISSYEQKYSPESILKDKNLSLSRSYEVNGITTNEFKDGDDILVRLEPEFSANALNGSYEIIDYLPSGLRPIDIEGNGYNQFNGSRLYPSEINDQKVTFVLNSKDITQPIYYHARVVSKGTYKAEPALLQSLKSLKSMTISNEDSITIR
ncbi:MAG: Ig-like domain-containing protein [Candidatus Taylorbacteria bacterium]|nr:Ig-like domain-containing protein [Candidatus Taylorbacteria bacterium]